MKKIATHDSVTGEKPKNLLSWLMIPFARTQSKTIKEQYEVGCRMFDIRVRYVNSVLYCAHGLFVTRRTLYSIIEEINQFGESCYVSITYEGRLPTLNDQDDFIKEITTYKKVFRKILWGEIAVKYTNKDLKVDWKNLLPAEQYYNTRQGFLPLDGKNWQTYLPIPWLWKKIYYNKPEFSTEIFTFVDFL